ncbi:MAG: hypothetical protein WBO70_03995 [Erysipelotrichaceae bacterium]
MKKIIIILLALMMFSGCTNKTVETKDDNLTKYNFYYQKIIDNEKFATSSINFDISLAINSVDGEFRYDVIVDNPQIAMHNIKMMAVEDDGSFSIDKTKVMPTVGIFESNSYHLVPNQINFNKGYVQGLSCSGMTKKTKGNILVVVFYNRDNDKEEVAEYFEFTYGA